MKPKYTDDRGAFLVWWRSYQNKCKKYKIAFLLSEEQFRDLVEAPCFYCGSEPQQTTWNKSRTIPHFHNGIDRMDNTRGYTLDNVVPCCSRCNYAKNNMTLDKFRELIIAIYKNWANS